MAQRWVLVALVALAGLLLVWTIATWPSAPEDLASTTRDEAEGDLEDYQVPAPELATGSAVLPPTAAEPEPPSEPEPELQAAEQPPAPAAAESAEARADALFVHENGPLAEYKQQFAAEPRDSAASDAEASVSGTFHPTDGPKPVFRSVLCRETICKIETRVSSASMGAYVAAMTRLVHSNFDSKLATERTSLVDGDEVSVVVYAKRPQ